MQANIYKQTKKQTLIYKEKFLQQKEINPKFLLFQNLDFAVYTLYTMLSIKTAIKKNKDGSI